jgi:hypothetical protein
VLIAADNQVPTLVVSFLAALVIVSPLAYRQVRKVQRARARLTATEKVDTAPDAPSPVGDDDLVTAAARIATEATSQPAGAQFTVDIPVLATLGGRPAERAIVESILADGLRRDGIEILERDGDHWRCRRPG